MPDTLTEYCSTDLHAAEASVGTAADRLQQLYRLPLGDREARWLAIGRVENALQALGRSNRPRRLQVMDMRRLDRLTGTAFDAVALPGSLTQTGPDATARPAELLAAAYSALRPGGLLVGHLDHLLSVPTLLRTGRGGRSLRGWWALRCVAHAAAVRRSLRRLGFDAVQTFYVEPSIAEPLALVPTVGPVARSHFLRAIRRTRSLYTRSGYGLRMALAAVGLGGQFQPQLFFWARRPC